MSYMVRRVFAEYSRELAERIVNTVEQFASSKQMNAFDRSALKQLATPLSDVSAELLMFGLDVWPDSAYDAPQEQSKMIELPRSLTRLVPSAMAAALAALLFIPPLINDHDGDGVVTFQDVKIEMIQREIMDINPM